MMGNAASPQEYEAQHEKQRATDMFNGYIETDGSGSRLRKLKISNSKVKHTLNAIATELMCQKTDRQSSNKHFQKQSPYEIAEKNRQLKYLLKTAYHTIYRLMRQRQELDPQGRAIRKQNAMLARQNKRLMILLEEKTIMLNQRILSQMEKRMDEEIDYSAEEPTLLLISKMQNRIQELKRQNQTLIQYNKHIKGYALPFILKIKGQVERVRSAGKEYIEEKDSKSRQYEASKEGTKTAFRKKRNSIVQSAWRQPQLLKLEWDSKSFDDQKLFLLSQTDVSYRPKGFQETFQIRKDEINIFQEAHKGCMASCQSPLPKAGKYRIKFFFVRNKQTKCPATIGIMTGSWKNKEYVRKSKELISYHFCGSFGAFDADQKQIIPWGQNLLGPTWSGAIEIVVDLDNWTIEFVRQSFPLLKIPRKVTRSSISTSFKNKDIFVFACLRNPGDRAGLRYK